MISTEYIQAGEKDPRIIKHEKHSTRRSLKGMLKRAFRTQKKINEYAAGNSHAEPSSTETLPYESLLKAHPQFHDLLDISNWPTLPPPTHPSHTPNQPNTLWQTPEQLNLLIRRWIDSPNSALPPPAFERACPIAYHHLRGIMTGDGINDWVTRAAVLAEVDRVRVPMLEATVFGEEVGEGRE